MNKLSPKKSKELLSSVHNLKNGRYVLGGTTEVSPRKLEWWSKNEMPRDPSDLVYYVEKAYEGRPDLLGYLFYGDPKLWWVIAQYNHILDPMSELIQGLPLLIPLKGRLQTEIFTKNKKIGGVTSTR